LAPFINDEANKQLSMQQKINKNGQNGEASVASLLVEIESHFISSRSFIVKQDHWETSVDGKLSHFQYKVANALVKKKP
jgi:hypothetical protein